MQLRKQNRRIAIAFARIAEAQEVRVRNHEVVERMQAPPREAPPAPVRLDKFLPNRIELNLPIK